MMDEMNGVTSWATDDFLYDMIDAAARYREEQLKVTFLYCKINLSNFVTNYNTDCLWILLLLMKKVN